MTEVMQIFGSHLPLKVAISDRQESLREEDLEFFHKQLFGIIDTDKGTNHVAWLVCPEI